MTKEQDSDRSDELADLEAQIRQGRRFTATEAMGRMAGPGAMKGASPVSPVKQAEIEVGTWLRSHVEDPSGALQSVLHRHLNGSQALLDNVDRPMAALALYCEQLLCSDYRLEEVVREADAEWGQRMGERPHFDTGGTPQDAGDPYTVESVRELLGKAVKQLAGSEASPS